MPLAWLDLAWHDLRVLARPGESPGLASCLIRLPRPALVAGGDEVLDELAERRA